MDRTSKPQGTPTLPLQEIFAEEGLEFLGLNEAGDVRVFNRADQREGVLPRAAIYEELAAEGFENPQSVQLEFNSPQTALNQAPPDLGVAGRPAFRNEKGFVNTLKKQYKDVQLTEDRGIVVNKDGVYYAIDPSGMANLDPVELSREILENAPEIASDAGFVAIGASIGGALGAAGGSVAIPGLGTVAGAKAGAVLGGMAGGAVSALYKTSFGRLKGTYQATPEEQLTDVALETVLTGAGYAIPAGVRSTADDVAKAFSKINSSAARPAYQWVLSRLARLGDVPADTLLSEPRKVQRVVRQAYEAAGKEANGAVVEANLNRKAGDIAEAWFREAQEELPRRFGKNLEELTDEAGARNVEFDLSDIARAPYQVFERLGIGRMVAEGGEASARQLRDESGNLILDATGNVATEAGKSGGRLRFVPYTEAEKLAKGASDLPEGAEEAITRLVNLMERYASNGKVTGKAGARRLADLNRKLNEELRDLYGKSNSLDRIVSEIGAAHKEAIGNGFARQGLGEKWVTTNADYIRFADAIEQSKSILKNPDGKYAFAKRLTSVMGGKGSAGDIAKDLVELLGERGQKYWDDIKLVHTGAVTARKAPQLGWASANSLGASFLVGTLNPVAGVAMAMGAAAASSPALERNLLNALPYLENLKTGLAGADDSMRRELLNNPNAISTLLKQALDGSATEEAMKSQLMGLVPGNETQR